MQDIGEATEQQYKLKYLEAEKKIAALVGELKRNQESMLSDENVDSMMIANIKGSLIQFLKNTPITDKQNEDLLKVIYSMMEFTKEEITELANNRMSLKGGKKLLTGSDRGQKSNSS